MYRYVSCISDVFNSDGTIFDEVTTYQTFVVFVRFMTNHALNLMFIPSMFYFKTGINISGMIQSSDSTFIKIVFIYKNMCKWECTIGLGVIVEQYILAALE